MLIKLAMYVRRWFSGLVFANKIIVVLLVLLFFLVVEAYFDMRVVWSEEVRVGGDVVLVKRMAKMSCPSWIPCDGNHETGGSVKFSYRGGQYDFEFAGIGSVAPVYLGLENGVVVLTVFDWANGSRCLSSYQLLDGGGGRIFENKKFPDFNLYIEYPESFNYVKLSNKPGPWGLEYAGYVKDGQVALNCSN